MCRGCVERVKTLAIYLMCGPETPELAEAAVEGGADLVELGFPFSDPLADGPVIRRAGERGSGGGHADRGASRLPQPHARAGGRAARADDLRLAPRGVRLRAFRSGHARAGATSLIVPDLPVDERPELSRIQLVAPTSTDERIPLAAARTDGWLYLVTLTGTTGARAGLSPALAGLVERTRALTQVPLYAGFGIATPEHARAACTLADGVVVGSRAVEVAEEGPHALRAYVGSLRAALDSVVPIAG